MTFSQIDITTSPKTFHFLRSYNYLKLLKLPWKLDYCIQKQCENIENVFTSIFDNRSVTQFSLLLKVIQHKI